jgi:hypothetical protein
LQGSTIPNPQPSPTCFGSDLHGVACDDVVGEVLLKRN